MAGLVGLGEVDRNAVGLAQLPVAAHSGRAGLRFPGRDSPQATVDAETLTVETERATSEGPAPLGSTRTRAGQKPGLHSGECDPSEKKAISQFRFKPLKCACRQSSLRGIPSGCEAP